MSYKWLNTLRVGRPERLGGDRLSPYGLGDGAAQPRGPVLFLQWRLPGVSW